MTFRAYVQHHRAAFWFLTWLGYVLMFAGLGLMALVVLR